MVLDLIQKVLFHNQVEDMAKMFRANMSSSAHANNKTRSILILGKEFIQGIGNTTIYEENK